LLLGGIVIAAASYYQNHKYEFQNSDHVVWLLKNLRSDGGVFFVYPQDSPTFKRVENILRRVVTSTYAVNEQEVAQCDVSNNVIDRRWYDPIIQSNTCAN
jgi:hypothetical protein